MKYRIMPSSDIQTDINIAKFALSSKGNPSNDEAMYNAAAYHTQQAIEKSLKFYLHSVYGEDETTRKFKTHSIGRLTDWLIKQYHHPIIPVVLDKEANITDWEAHSRYNHDLAATREEISAVLQYAEKMLEHVKLLEGKLERGEEITRDDLDITHQE